MNRMRWRNAWIVMRKDLDEFTKQKLVIGSIVAMPIFLGVVLPLLTFLPVITVIPPGDTWDVQGLIETGETPRDYMDPLTDQSRVNETIQHSFLQHTRIQNATVNASMIIDCIVDNSTLVDSTIYHSTLTYSQTTHVTIIRSKGTMLNGSMILAVDSNLTFVNKKPSEIYTVLPMMLNMVLMIFIIVPATLPTIIASYSIVGEKNNRSLEPLLATPTTDGELLAGKIFSSFIPSMVSTAIAFSLGVILLDIVLTPYIGYAPLPTFTWILSIVLLAPTACLMSILACVIISSKVTDVRAAQQVGGFVVMPVVVLMLGVISGLTLLSPVLVIVFAGVYAGIDVTLFYFAKAVFNREDILVKWK